jgi:hypothetical protein
MTQSRGLYARVQVQTIFLAAMKKFAELTTPSPLFLAQVVPGCPAVRWVLCDV